MDVRGGCSGKWVARLPTVQFAHGERLIHAFEYSTYYIAPNGPDGHPGTEKQPWRSIQHAADRVHPGDTVRIRAGDYYVGPGLYFRRGGTAKAPIVYRAYGDGPVRITNSTRFISAPAAVKLLCAVF